MFSLKSLITQLCIEGEAQNKIKKEVLTIIKSTFVVLKPKVINMSNKKGQKPPLRTIQLL